MGKPTGFLEFQRELPTDRSAQFRIADWKEFHLPMLKADLRKQGYLDHLTAHRTKLVDMLEGRLPLPGMGA